MLQLYVSNVSAVSVLCCSKCFHVASYKYFILDVAYVSHICCKCMFQMFHPLHTYLHSSVSCCTSFMLFRESGCAGSDGGTARAPGNGARRAGSRWTGRAQGRWSGHDGGRVLVWGKASPPDTRALRQDEMRMRGGKNQRTGSGCAGVRTCVSVRTSRR
jgi:hypothetical protein